MKMAAPRLRRYSAHSLQAAYSPPPGSAQQNRTEHKKHKSEHKKHKKYAPYDFFLCFLCSDLCFLCSVSVSLCKAGRWGVSRPNCAVFVCLSPNVSRLPPG